MNEADSFEQEKTDGISEHVDALKGFLDENGLAGGSPSGDGDGEKDGQPATPSDDQQEDVPFDQAVSAVEGRWTSHGGEAPEHEPVPVHDAPGAEASGDGGDDAEGGWEPVTAPDGEQLDERGGSSDGSESGQDSGSMT